MIEQQYYTRQQIGVLNQADSYDTVAKTPLIKLEFIKKNLHPLCSYDIPYELQKNGEMDEAQYPPNFIIFPIETGEMIVGQAVYKNKDFIGNRHGFFVHNFILSENEKRRYIKEPEKLFGITDFATDCSRIKGKELPTLAGIPYSAENDYFKDRDKLFFKIGMDQILFNKLIYATFIVAHSKKKIYIVLDVPLQELGELSKALMYHLYQELPWSITETLRICTYSAKLKTKQGMQITFVDPHTLVYDNKIEKEFIFDFVNQRFLNIEKDVELEPYIQSAYHYTHNKLAWEKFNKWADELSVTLKNKSDRKIGYYGKIVTYFEISVLLKLGKSYDLSNLKLRRSLMKQLLKDIESPISDEIKDELIQVLEYIITLIGESVLKGSLLTKDEIKGLLYFKVVYNQGNLAQNNHCIQILMDLLESAVHQKNQFYIEMTLQQVKKYPDTYIQLYRKIYDKPELRVKIVDPMIDTILNRIHGIDEFIKKLETLNTLESLLISDSEYQEKIYQCFNRCLSQSEDLVEVLLRVQKWSEQYTGDFYNDLVNRCENYFLENVDLKAINAETTLCHLTFKCSHVQENYQAIMIYQKLRTDLSFMSPNKIKIDKKVQELIQMYYQDNLCEDNFYMLVYAFLELETDSDETKPRLNLQRVLEYLNDINLEILLDFIVWMTGQVVYIEKNTFNDQVIEFFMKLKQEEKKISTKKIKEKLEAQEKTQILCKKILRNQKYGFLLKKLTHKNYFS